MIDQAFNPSRLFIERPVATTLLTIGIALAGAMAFALLPVSPLPQVDFPTISVNAGLPGASPETMAATVATPLERALGRIAGVTEMTSSSGLGSTNVTLQFDLSRDINGAARDVQAAINAARNLLPTGLPNNPNYRKVNPADAPILILAMTSDTLSRSQMFDAADTILAQKISQVAGVGNVNVGGAARPAVRVELNPSQLNNAGIGVEQVRNAIASTNANRPKGVLDDGTHAWQIYANDQSKTAAEYRPLIVAYQKGAPVRLGDVAQVIDSNQDLRNAGLANGKQSVVMIIFRQPNANIIDTVDRIKALLPQFRASIPAAIDLTIMLDRTTTIRASLRDTETTLLLSVALVILVVFLFLGNARAALIPSVAVPVSLIGTFGAMYLFGYSLNIFTLMALTVATGFVVDDAVVVLENVSRYIEEGMRPFEAAMRGAKEVGFTVLSMSFSLIAVFIPILLMGGIVGRLFREFAVTLSVAILVSLVVSLTTTPMMCAYVLKPRKTDDNADGEGDARRGARPRRRRARRRFLSGVDRRVVQQIARGSAWAVDGMTRGYTRSLGWALGAAPLMIVILFATVALNVWLYTIVPKGFFPQQDTGRMGGAIQADQAISFQAMQTKLERFVKIVRADPAVVNVIAFTGGGQRNFGNMFVALKPLSERKETIDQVIGRLRRATAREPGATLYFQAVQDIRIGGRSSNALYQYTLQADDLNELRAWEPKIRQALTQLPELTDVNTDTQDKGLQTSLVIDRDAASRLGITAVAVDTTLNDLFGQRQVSTIYNPLNQYKVVMEAAPQYWQSPDSLKDVFVASRTGASIPLSSFAHYETTNTALRVNHQGQFVASTISFNLPENASLSTATNAIENAMSRIGVPSSIHGGFQGTAKAFQDSLASQPILIATALLAVFIVLGILYESLVHPLTILSTLPSAGVGAWLALLATDTEFSIIALIGVILLIGIVKKNAIMMIDFAIARGRDRGLTPRDAIFEAATLRFRPIMMTTLAALFGALPLALGAGDGAELRRPLGIAIVGGLLVSQVLTLYTTPVVYLYFDRMSHWARRRRERRNERSRARDEARVSDRPSHA
ncbi:MAG: efflux RND transporter permease subunit [Burkholderiaceae bacterium]